MFTSIQAVEGGFIVELDGKIQVTTSLNKAIKLVRDSLNEGKEESNED